LNSTFREYYKLSSSSFETAEAFHAEREEALKSWHIFVDKIGALSARPDRSGYMKSVLFAGENVPDNWRQIGRHEQGVECVPHRGSKAGKEIAEKMKSLPRVLDYKTVIERISVDVAKSSQVRNGNLMMWTTAQRLSLPEVVYVVSVPRALNDGLQIPDDWIEINEREYTLAFHKHNSEADRLNSETENAA